MKKYIDIWFRADSINTIRHQEILTYDCGDDWLEVRYADRDLMFYNRDVIHTFSITEE